MSLYGYISEILFTAARPYLNRKYDEGNDQRYGYYPDDVPGSALWVHAVSVGEVQSAYPFVKEVKKNVPDLPVLLSTITKTGKMMSQQLMRDLVTRIYYPWDAPSVLRRALDKLRPRAYVTVETEIWPEMLLQLEKRRIPAFLVNGRLSESSFEKYHRFRSFWSKVIRRYSLILARTEAERQRFIALGADEDKVRVTGDCKVDALIERKNNADISEVKKYFSGERPTILAGSTHEGEDEIVFQSYRELLKEFPSLRLVVVPRHPERADAIQALAESMGFSQIALMSREPHEWNILIVDRIGVLFPIYGCVNAAFLGGSIAPKGGQNIMEPAIWEIPFCQGPDYHDFTEATEGLIKEGVCEIVYDSEEMTRFFAGVLSHKAHLDCAAGSHRFFEALGGASQKSWDLVRHCMSSV